MNLSWSVSRILWRAPFPMFISKEGFLWIGTWHLFQPASWAQRLDENM